MKQKKISYKGEKLNYIITSEGTVFSCYSNKYLKLTKLNTGYIDVVLKVCGEKKHFSVHRLVAEAFLKNPKNYKYVNHINGNKEDNRIENLEWMSQKENVEYNYKVLNKNRAYGARNIIKEGISEENPLWKRYRDTDYLISKDGEVYNEKTKIKLKQTPNSAGYIRYNLMIKGKKKQFQAHRLVAEVWINGGLEISESLVVNHIDGNTINNNIDNLEIVSKSENIKHSCYVLKKSIKPVYSIDKDGSRIDYASLTEASLAEGVTLSAISFSLKSDGKQKSCGKYWFYK